MPVLEPTKRVLILLPGSNPPFIVQTVTSCFTDKTVLRLIKPKVQREQIKRCVIHGRLNVLSVVPTTPFNPKKPHKCYHVSCINCGEFKHVNHRWYIQPIAEKEPQEQEEQDPSEEPLQWQCEDDDNENENSGPPPRPILVFADIECALSEDRVFVPNLICWSSEEDADQVHHSYSMEEFLEALQALTEVETDARGRKVITFFHNLRGFDGNFILAQAAQTHVTKEGCNLHTIGYAPVSRYRRPLKI